jgi:hypothetical protein
MLLEKSAEVFLVPEASLLRELGNWHVRFDEQLLDAIQLPSVYLFERCCTHAVVSSRRR